MKNIIKNIGLLLLLLVLANCTKDEVVSGNSFPETGFIVFSNAATTTGEIVESVSIPVNVEVPIYRNGLTISYEIQPVEGDISNFVASLSGTTFADPSDNTRNVTIDIPLMNMEVDRTSINTFDVVLTGVNVGGITLGVAGNDIISHRVTLPCSSGNPPVLPSDYFVGDYTISDIAATIGPGNGSENFAAGTVTLTVDPSNPNNRLFTSAVVPAFNPNLEDIVLSFETDDTVLLGPVDPSLACSAAGPYIYTSAAAGNNALWDICNDESITITYIEDPNGSCGGPYDSSFSLIKQ